MGQAWEEEHGQVSFLGGDGAARPCHRLDVR
jgi:hypothetical protein